MCFRPAEISMKRCPDCGKINKPIAKVCEDCGAELDNTKGDFDADQSALDAAMKPGAVPVAPAAPGAPTVPGAPNTPKAPGQ